MGSPSRVFVLINVKPMILFEAAWVVPKLCLHVIILQLKPTGYSAKSRISIFKRINNKLLWNGNNFQSLRSSLSLVHLVNSVSSQALQI